MIINISILAQSSMNVKEKGYKGYIFPKEHSIWGFPPEQNRYTPSEEDIVQAEKILKDSICSDYVKFNQQQYKKPPINKKTLKNYVRQYVGYLTDNKEIVIWLNLIKKEYAYDGVQNPSYDIISIKDGGYNFWSIRINITTRKLYDMRVNGES
ncbi:MAG: hypothetical protein LBL13_06155 [Bacteroidales bacterium]|nr:hypothetical protein [Bacteroidales bacterium]